MYHLLAPQQPFNRGFHANLAGAVQSPHLWRRLQIAYAPWLANDWDDDGLANWAGDRVATANFGVAKAKYSQERYGLALDLKGSSAELQDTLVSDWSFTKGTICWSLFPRYSPTDGLSHAWFGQGTGGGAPEFGFLKFSDDNIFAGWAPDYGAGDDRVSLAASSTNAPEDTWSDYAFTWESTGVSTLYHDGREIGNNGGSTTVSNIGTNLHLGEVTTIVGGEFDGFMGYWFFWDRILSENEIAEIAFDARSMFRVRDPSFSIIPAGTASALTLIKFGNFGGPTGIERDAQTSFDMAGTGIIPEVAVTATTAIEFGQDDAPFQDIRQTINLTSSVSVDDNFQRPGNSFLLRQDVCADTGFLASNRFRR